MCVGRFTFYSFHFSFYFSIYEFFYMETENMSELPFYTLNVLVLLTIASCEKWSTDKTCLGLRSDKPMDTDLMNTCFFAQFLPKLPEDSSLKCGLIGLTGDCKCLVFANNEMKETKLSYSYLQVTPQSSGQYISFTNEIEILSNQKFKTTYTEGKLSFPIRGVFVDIAEEFVDAYICRDNHRLNYADNSSSAAVLTTTQNPVNSTLRKAFQVLEENEISTQNLMKVNQDGCPPIPKNFCKLKT